MKELVVISGKGGTGKTSMVACLAALESGAVLADCDVDAADLHLVLEPQIKHRQDFSGGRLARVEPDLCTSCGRCLEVCRFGAVIAPEDPGGAFSIDPILCEGCGVCHYFCEFGAIPFEEQVNGEWYISDTRHGPMAHARLGVAEENSGKLVSVVRREARRIAEEQGRELIIVDGSPGIGCPVIASITGADMVLIVTEPTLSGEHDLGRVAALARHFVIPAAVCVNKADINPEITDRIRARSQENGLLFAGTILYDTGFTRAQLQARSLVEIEGGSPAADAVRGIWSAVRARLFDAGNPSQ
jgi:MinD superfamily P-loop ATPase